MTQYFKVRIVEDGEERIHDGYTNPWMAVGFAAGYAQCLAEFGTQMMTPCVQSAQGYHWWAKHEELKIEVLNPQGQIFKGVE